MLRIYGHPFAAFYWKACIAAYERNVPFEFMMCDQDHPENGAFITQAGPGGQFPVLDHDGRVVIESAAIIEYLDLNFGDAAPMVPADPRAAIEARQMDGVFDDYVMNVVNRMVFAVLRPPEKRDPHVEPEVVASLTKSYAWLETWFTGRTWAANETFGIADIAAVPALHYAHWAFPIPAGHKNLLAYRARLMARPSVRRVLDEARPYRDFFPLKDRGPCPD
jgi:glutathione S-transferase